MKKGKKLRRNMIKRLACLCLILAICLPFTGCGRAWDHLWGRGDETEVSSDLLVIPGSGTPEDTFESFENAVEYTGEVHEGTNIYYPNPNKGPNREKIIVIDAGHQAEGDSSKEPIGPGATETKIKVSWGAEGKHSGPEHALNLAVALLLRDELIKRGYSVVMIRETGDVNISNKERAEIANEYHAAAYVRIHANYYDDPETRGAATICQSEDNPYPDCAAHYEESRLLSELILSSYCLNTTIPSYGVLEMDNMAGTNWSQVPTTILEMGFLSNSEDDMAMKLFMLDKELGMPAAKGIADGLEKFFALMAASSETQTGS